MALIAIAADKGSPGVTTASVALAAVWPRPVLLAECDPAGGDLVYRLPAAGGGRLDPRRGLLNLALAARRGLAPHQVWEHTQKLHGGLDILAGVSGAEQGAGLELLWGSVGRLLADVPQADVIADCGRLGADGPIYDLLAHAASVVLLTRASVGEVVRLRDRAAAVTAALAKRGWTAARVKVVVIADYRHIGPAVDEVGQALRGSGAPVRVLGGLAHEPKSAEQLSGQWGGKLDRSMFIRTARSIAAGLAADLPAPAPAPDASLPATAQPPGPGPAPAPGPGLAPGPVPVPGPGQNFGPAPGPARGPAPVPGPGQSFGPTPGPGPGPAPSSGPGPAPMPGPPPASGPPLSPHPGPQHAPPGWGQPPADLAWIPSSADPTGTQPPLDPAWTPPSDGPAWTPSSADPSGMQPPAGLAWIPQPGPPAQPDPPRGRHAGGQPAEPPPGPPPGSQPPAHQPSQPEPAPRPPGRR